MRPTTILPVIYVNISMIPGCDPCTSIPRRNRNTIVERVFIYEMLLLTYDACY